METNENNTAVTTPEVHWVPEWNVEGLQKVIARLNRRAAKLGAEPITLTATGETRTFDKWKRIGTLDSVTIERGHNLPFAWREEAKEGLAQIIHSYDKIGYTVSGVAPKIDGWNLLARIEHAGERNFVYTVPGTEAPESAYTADRTCDHCRHNRVRKDTFLVEKDGEVKQVGSTCLKDFLGHQAPESILKQAELIFSLTTKVGEFDEDADYGPEGEMRDYFRIGSVEFLAHTSAIIRGIGWVSGKVAYQNRQASTKDMVIEWMFTRDERVDAYFNKQTGGVAKSDYDLAKAALAWARDELDPKSDYEQNLKSAAVNEDITFRATGILASLIVAYNRHQEKEIKRRDFANGRKTLATGGAGEVGERKVFKGIVTRARSFEGNFGPVRILAIRTEDDHEVTTFASSAWAQRVNVGDEIEIKATIKKIDSFAGADQTVVSRATLIKRVDRTGPEEG